MQFFVCSVIFRLYSVFQSIVDTMFDNYEAILVSLKKNLPDSKIVLLSLTAMRAIRL